MKNNKRIYILDLIRGLCIFLMCFDHLMYDLTSFGIMSYIFDLSKTNKIMILADKYYYCHFRTFIMYLVLFILFILVGINHSISKDNYQRGKKLFNIALGISLFSYIIGLFINNKNVFISFGVIHAISISIIINSYLCKKINKNYSYLIISIILGSIGSYLKYFYNGGVISISYGAYEMPVILFYQVLGLCLFGLDSFSLLLVEAQILIGVFISKYLHFNYVYKNNIFSFLGRYSIYFYFGSQFICVVILTVIFLFTGYSIKLW